MNKAAFKCIVAGSRSIQDRDFIFGRLDFLLRNKMKDLEIVCGRCRGPDLIGAEWAALNGVPIKDFPADWKTYGKRAGMIRNKEMALYGDALIAFWDGQSRGTHNMIEEAKKEFLEIRIIKY